MDGLEGGSPTWQFSLRCWISLLVRIVELLSLVRMVATSLQVSSISQIKNIKLGPHLEKYPNRLLSRAAFIELETVDFSVQFGKGCFSSSIIDAKKVTVGELVEFS
jgi:hypothetical protein